MGQAENARRRAGVARTTITTTPNAEKPWSATPQPFCKRLASESRLDFTEIFKDEDTLAGIVN
jgi:hypothetical protein